MYIHITNIKDNPLTPFHHNNILVSHDKKISIINWFSVVQWRHSESLTKYDMSLSKINHLHDVHLVLIQGTIFVIMWCDQLLGVSNMVL